MEEIVAPPQSSLVPQSSISPLHELRDKLKERRKARGDDSSVNKLQVITDFSVEVDENCPASDENWESDGFLSPNGTKMPSKRLFQQLNEPSLHKALGKKTSGGMTWVANERNHSNGGTNGVKSSYSEEEVAAFSAHINAALDEDTLVRHLLPVGPGVSDLINSCKDGIIIARLVAYATAGTSPVGREIEALHASQLNVFQNTPTSTISEQLENYKKHENASIALRSAGKAGLSTCNMGPSDINNGNQSIILGLLWQSIKLAVENFVCLRACPELEYLAQPGETLKDIEDLCVESKLCRWINYHLSFSGCSMRVCNIGQDLRDGRVLCQLLRCLGAKKLQAEENDTMLKCTTRAVRAALALGVPTSVSALSLVAGNSKLRTLFLAQLFNAGPRIIVPTTDTIRGITSFQAIVRGSTTRQRIRAPLQSWIEELRSRACIKIQAQWRGHEARIMVSRERAKVFLLKAIMGVIKVRKLSIMVGQTRSILKACFGARIAAIQLQKSWRRVLAVRLTQRLLIKNKAQAASMKRAKLVHTCKESYHQFKRCAERIQAQWHRSAILLEYHVCIHQNTIILVLFTFLACSTISIVLLLYLYFRVFQYVIVGSF